MSIIEITKQYIESDSNIASPTNNVLVMVPPESGCWAIELNADEIERPCPNAGIITPMPVVKPAVTIDTTAIKAELSIRYLLLIFILYFPPLKAWLPVWRRLYTL